VLFKVSFDKTDSGNGVKQWNCCGVLLVPLETVVPRVMWLSSVGPCEEMMDF